MSRNDFDSLFDRLDALTVGFGPLFREFKFETPGYPPHNIYKTSDSNLRLDLAVAGFKKSEIEVRELNGEVSIQGVKGEPETDTDKDGSGYGYQYRGISNRSFIKRFKLAEYYEVDEVTLEDGMLSVTFIRNEPEATKPKVFAIK